MNNYLDNKIVVEGKQTGHINSVIGYDLECNLYYQNKIFNLNNLESVGSTKILHFSRVKTKSNRPINTILLGITPFNENYHYFAIGIKRYDDGTGNPESVSLGKDLEIIISDSAQNAIKQLKI